MALPDKLGEMAQFANEVQNTMDREVELLEFTKAGQNGQETLTATRRSGAKIGAETAKAGQMGGGGWWFCQILKDGEKQVARPIAKFNPELFFEARPVERLYVEQAFEREQKQFESEVKGDVIEWTPITRMITVQPDGALELGEFATHFGGGLAFANIGKARGENAPLLGVAPTTSNNAFKVKDAKLQVPRLDRILGLKEAKEFPAEWNEERKMLIVYLEGVNAQIKM